MKIILVLGVFVGSLFANGYLESIYENIALKSTKDAIKSVKVLQKNVKKENFTNVVKSWKRVEAFYILADLNDDYIDIPRYIDIFHHGNEDIKIQLDKIVADKEDLSISLYKNSHKGINALEYILFTKDLNNKRVKDIIQIITSNMIINLEDIYNGYVESKDEFLKDMRKANAIMLNSLIENSYKLKEWRIGDAAGLSRKYKGKPDNRRAEYFISKNSKVAIESIIDTHLDVLDEREFKNYGSLIKSYGVTDEINDAIKYLKDSKNNLSLVQNDDFSKAKPLFKSAKKLHITYYITLIGKLKVTAKVLDADGD